MKRNRTYALMLLAVLACACGTARRTARPEASVTDLRQMPVDSAALAAAQERARIILDSAARVQAEREVRPIGTEDAAPETKPLADQVLEYARTFLGVPYKLGAAGPDRFDCSGFTRYVFMEFGYPLTHSSAAQYKECRKVESFGDLRKGDLAFFGARNSIRNIGHVGIVTEVDQERGFFHFIHASTSHGVELQRSTQPYFMMRYIGAGRILPD